MNNYNVYKVSDYFDDSDEFFIIYSRQPSGKRRNTLKRNAIEGCKGEIYDFIRKIGPNNFSVGDTLDEDAQFYNRNLSLEEAKKKSFLVKEKVKTISINRHKQEISILEDDIEELLDANTDLNSCEAEFPDRFINENKEKIKKLEGRIQIISKL